MGVDVVVVVVVAESGEGEIDGELLGVGTGVETVLGEDGVGLVGRIGRANGFCEGGETDD